MSISWFKAESQTKNTRAQELLRWPTLAEKQTWIGNCTKVSNIQGHIFVKNFVIGILGWFLSKLTQTNNNKILFILYTKIHLFKILQQTTQAVN